MQDSTDPGFAARIRALVHRRKVIMLIDFSHAEAPEMMTMLDEVQQQISAEPEKSVLTLADFTGAHVDRNVAARIKEVLVLDRPFVKRSAWVGTDSVPHVFFENFKSFSQRDFPTFTSREEAMEWLVKEAA